MQFIYIHIYTHIYIYIHTHIYIYKKTIYNHYYGNMGNKVQNFSKGKTGWKVVVGKEICLEVTNTQLELCFYFLFFERRKKVGRIVLGE